MAERRRQREVCTRRWDTQKVCYGAELWLRNRSRAQMVASGKIREGTGAGDIFQDMDSRAVWQGGDCETVYRWLAAVRGTGDGVDGNWQGAAVCGVLVRIRLTSRGVSVATLSYWFTTPQFKLPLDTSCMCAALYPVLINQELVAQLLDGDAKYEYETVLLKTTNRILTRGK